MEQTIFNLQLIQAFMRDYDIEADNRPMSNLEETAHDLLQDVYDNLINNAKDIDRLVNDLCEVIEKY